jgi:tetratricopeptide (TPR) repeat protein
MTNHASPSRPWPRALALTALLTSVGAPAFAQLPTLDLPDASPAASRTQVLGATTLEVRWSRPGVKGREIWGKLVPWGEVWRAGANENTTFTTSTEITFGGQQLPAGTYGLHVLPVETGPWTLILTRDAGGWGSYGYEPANDALRVAVEPREAPFEERLDLRFDELTNSTATFALRWERRELAVPIAIAWPESVLADLRRQLRGRPQFGWVAWNQAAGWSLQNGGNLDEALAWIDRSLGMQCNFTNLRTKAAILEQRGDTAGAAAHREEALQVGSESELNRLGQQLVGEGKLDEAVTVLKRNADRNPKSFAVWEALAGAAAKAGDLRLARTYYERALKLAPEAQQAKIREAIAGLGK